VSKKKKMTVILSASPFLAAGWCCSFPWKRVYSELRQMERELEGYIYHPTSSLGTNARWQEEVVEQPDFCIHAEQPLTPDPWA
jgi:hypothetical protein